MAMGKIMSTFYWIVCVLTFPFLACLCPFLLLPPPLFNSKKG